MANIKSAKKRVKTIAKKTANNKVKKSIVKSTEKRFLEAIEAGDKELAVERFKACEKAIDKAATKNILHKNAAARKVSRLAKKLKC